MKHAYNLKSIKALLNAALIFEAFLFNACTYFTEHDFTITNASSHQVTFTVRGYNSTEYTLSSGQKLTLSLYDNPSLIFTDNPRVYWVSGTSSGTINDSVYYEYTVNNTSSEDITLKEKNGMLGDVYGTEETIAVNTPRIVKVYTKSPVWQAEFTNGSTEENPLAFLIIEQN